MMNSSQDMSALKALIELALTRVGELDARVNAAAMDAPAPVPSEPSFDTVGDPMPSDAPISPEPCLFDLAYLTPLEKAVDECKLYIYYPKATGGVVQYSGVSCSYSQEHRAVFDPATSESFPEDDAWRRITAESGTIFLNVGKDPGGDGHVWWLDTVQASDGADVSIQVGSADASDFRVRQTFHGVLVLGGGDGGGFGPAPEGEAVEVVLGGTDYNASEDTWTYGDVDEGTGLPTYPTYNPSRLYWHEDQHQLLQFRRLETHNPNGALVYVGPETKTVVFTAVQEMP